MTEPSTGQAQDLPPLVLFVTGSTGGHVTPALAVAEALSELREPPRTVFCGPAKAVAERLVTAAGGVFVPLEVHPIRGAGAARLLRGLAHLPIGMIRSFQLLRALRPDVVVGTGAHTSGPLIALAALHGIPTLVLEANVEVGLANRLLGPMVDGVAVAWPQTVGALPGRDFLSGWPVRRTLRERTNHPRPARDGFHLLILGGSAGASALDHAVREAIGHLGPIRDRLSVVHQASPGEVDRMREHYRAAEMRAVVEPFFLDLMDHYERADLVISRAGAATLAELAAVGRPAILVPLAAAGEHQRANARAWEAAGCARCLLPDELTGASLASEVLRLVNDRPALARMSAAARARHRPEAAQSLAEWCLSAAQRRRRS